MLSALDREYVAELQYACRCSAIPLMLSQAHTCIVYVSIQGSTFNCSTFNSLSLSLATLMVNLESGNSPSTIFLSYICVFSMNPFLHSCMLAFPTA